MTKDDWLVIGRIVAPQGLDGELRVYPDSDFPERFLEPGQRWLLRPGESEPQPVELLGGRFVPGKGIYVVELADVEDRDQAEALRDAVLMVPDSDRPTLEADEYHVVDLIGLQVFHQQTGLSLGVVVDVISAGNDLLQVALNPSAVSSEASLEPAEEQNESGAETSLRRGGRKKRKSSRKKATQPTVLVPFVKEIVPIVDLPNHRLEMNPPPGLLENLS